MRKYYFTLVAALLTLSTTVTAQTTKKPILYTTAQQVNADIAETTLPKNVDRNVKLAFPKVSLSSKTNSSFAGLLRADGSDPEIIVNQPEGTLHKSWYQYSEGWTTFWGFYTYKVYADGGAIDWVDGNDGNIYVKNLIGTYYSNAWLKGEKAEGDTVVFNLPQAIYGQTSDGETEYYSLWRYKFSEEDNWYFPDDSVQSVKFVLRGDSLVFAESDDINCMIGLGLADGGDWAGYGDYLVSLKKFEYPTVSPSSPASAEDYLMIYAASTEDGKDYQTVKVAVEGDDIYLGALTDNQPNAWAKGKLEGNKATFETNQYLGVDTVTEAHVYFVTCGHDSLYDADYDYYYDSVYSIKQLVFDYDPVAKTLKNAVEGMSVSKGTVDLNPQAEYFEPSIAPWTEKAGTPMVPTITDFMAYDVDYGYGGIQFYLNRLSTDSLFLPAKHLYYKAYLDDEEFTFDTDTYTALEQPLTEVPYLYTDGSEIQYYGDNHIFYFYVAGFDKIGIQEIYNDGTTKLLSEIAWQNVEEEEDDVKGIETNGADVKSVKYYDLSGRAISKISHGLYIKTTTLADGTISAKKVMVK